MLPSPPFKASPIEPEQVSRAREWDDFLLRPSDSSQLWQQTTWSQTYKGTVGWREDAMVKCTDGTPDIHLQLLLSAQLGSRDHSKTHSSKYYIKKLLWLQRKLLLSSSDLDSCPPLLFIAYSQHQSSLSPAWILLSLWEEAKKKKSLRASSGWSDSLSIQSVVQQHHPAVKQNKMKH